MLFHSTEFLLFLAGFLLGYGLVRRSLRGRNLLIVAASYVFYGWWDWRFLGLLAGTSVVDYAAGRAMRRTGDERIRRRWLALSVGLNLAVLGVFKYLGFFLESFQALLATLGVPHPSWTWQVILPVGISFYTFQSLSYSVDVFRRRLEPTDDLVAFLAYVAFFPQLVAGPIERATHLLPQFQSPRRIRIRDVEDGVWWVLWGLFKKVVVADHLAPYVELAFDRGPVPGPVLVLGSLAFAGQIYGDFSGYSDVARGLARFLGFDLSPNFGLPYAATSVRDFWRRWHITLSTWLRDYLYVPLGGNRGGRVRTRWNLFLTLLLGGLWHGASWNFVLWGAWHGAALVVHRWWTERPLPAGSPQDTVSAQARPEAGAWTSFLGWSGTFATVLYGWLLFRASAPGQLAQVHASLAVWRVPGWLGDYALGIACWSMPLVLAHLRPGRSEPEGVPDSLPGWRRALVQGALLFAVAAFWERREVPFLYFQF